MRELFKKKSFFCFTPEVMIATFAVEIILALYVFLRYRATKFVKISIFLLVLLSLFQLAEYNVCGGDFMLPWSRFGFFMITMIPVVGLELISLITKRRHFIGLAYFLMAFFLVVFAALPGAIMQATCKGNYIMFETAWHGISMSFLVYYFGLLFWGMWEILEDIVKMKNAEKINEDKKELLTWIFIGYISFLIPTGIVNVITQMGIDIIPSVLCGFAVLLAVILAFKIVPLTKKIGL